MERADYSMDLEGRGNVGVEEPNCRRSLMWMMESFCRTWGASEELNRMVMI